MKPQLYIYLFIFIIQFSCNQKSDNPAVDHESGILNPVLSFRPNILWLVAEDLSPYIPAFGDSTVVTPNLDRLSSTGVCYDNFFSPHPVCAPARAAIITGMYANHINASHMRTGPWYSPNPSQQDIDRYTQGMPEGIAAYEAVPPVEVRMFTEYLRANGYYCTNNSKEDYQFRKTMTAWDESSNKAHWRNRPKNKPFFSVFNFGVTHESRIWAKAKDSLLVDEKMVVDVPPYLPDTEVGRSDIRRMYSNIKELDIEVGKILDLLEADGLLDSTVIMWYSDHGGPLPRQKRLLYDSGIKVPLIICFPGGQFARQRDARMISFIDLAPTVLSLAGIKSPEYMDGTAFLGQHIRSVEPDYVFGAADRFDGLTDRNRSVRDSRYKYIKYYMPEKPMIVEVKYRMQMPVMQELLRLRDAGQLTDQQALWFRSQKPEEELFDLVNDPHELNNLASDSTYAEKLMELRQACDNWVKTIDDSGLKPETELIEELWPGQIQPITSDPVITRDESGITISCITQGASIGYKIVLPHEEEEQNLSWTVYSKSVVLPDSTNLIAKAHRIGYKPSAEVHLLNDNTNKD